MSRRAGVVAMQGDVTEHLDALERAFGPACDTTSVRSPEDVRLCDVIVLPGGESTTISRLIRENDLAASLEGHVAAGKPLLATCAGLIVAANDVPDARVETLDLLDISIERNAFGRQRESFEAPIAVDGLDEPFPGVFIRAPRITEVGEADVLATYREEPVAVRQGPVVGACFHPELTADPRVHRLALRQLEEPK